MNQYQKYKEATIYSMSAPELLFVLFEEAISRLKKAEYALEDQDYVLFDDCLTRAARIIRYLIDILDRSQPLSIDLRRIYHYLIMDISKIRAGREREKEEIGRIRHILNELFEGFEEASRRVAGSNLTQSSAYR